MSQDMDRIDGLEMRLAEQDRTIEDLNAAVTAQWTALDALKRQMGQFVERLAEAEAASRAKPTSRPRIIEAGGEDQSSAPRGFARASALGAVSPCPVMAGTSPAMTGGWVEQNIRPSMFRAASHGGPDRFSLTCPGKFG
jgi:SlyX protein